eukprot:jgi/Mesvir1/2757/Mv06699-RA.1
MVRGSAEVPGVTACRTSFPLRPLVHRERASFPAVASLPPLPSASCWYAAVPRAGCIVENACSQLARRASDVGSTQPAMVMLASRNGQRPSRGNASHAALPEGREALGTSAAPEGLGTSLASSGVGFRHGDAFLPLALIFFCATFNYTILRDTKDALVITAPGGGVEQIPFLTTYFVLPTSVLFVVFYGRLCQLLPPGTVFYAALLPFLAFFAFFGLSLLHRPDLADKLLAVLPKSLAGMVSIFRNWTLSLFYVDSSSSASPACASRGGDRLVAHGAAAGHRSGSSRGRHHVLDAPQAAAVRQGGRCSWQAQGGVPPKRRPKISLAESVRILLQSPRLRNLTMVVVGYGISTSLFDVSWKNQLRQLYTSPQLPVLIALAAGTGRAVGARRPSH